MLCAYLLDNRPYLLQLDRLSSRVSFGHELSETFVQVLELQAKILPVNESLVPSNQVTFVRVQRFKFCEEGHLRTQDFIMQLQLFLQIQLMELQ